MTKLVSKLLTLLTKLRLRLHFGVFSSNLWRKKGRKNQSSKRKNKLQCTFLPGTILSSKCSIAIDDISRNSWKIFMISFIGLQKLVNLNTEWQIILGELHMCSEVHCWFWEFPIHYKSHQWSCPEWNNKGWLQCIFQNSRKANSSWCQLQLKYRNALHSDDAF